MHDFIVGPGSDEEAAAAASTNSGLPQKIVSLLFRGSATLEPFERVMIYRGQYLTRMVDALSVDYPGIALFLGEDRFFSAGRRIRSSLPLPQLYSESAGQSLPRIYRWSQLAPEAKFSQRSGPPRTGDLPGF